MTEEHWRRVKALFQAAAEHPPDQRDAFLDTATGDDKAVRCEVSSLLASDGSDHSFLDQWPVVSAELVADLPSRTILAPGVRIGPYEIVTLLGSGSMGEVYRARDVQLNRDVALKVLPAVFACDVDRLARFRREAQVLATLNHRNIAGIYGLEDSDRAIALVLEFADGPTLADRMAQGRLTLEDSLSIARQVTEALAAAHEKGIVHRDLKPANIAICRDGVVKVLDFGLARVSDDADEPQLAGSPSPRATGVNNRAVLGTPAYMSPEQARGRSLDKRTDLWSFGCVLYEMLTGCPPFAGETAAETLEAIIGHDIAHTAVPAHTPPPIRRLLRRCLEKNREKRLDSAVAARLEIDDAIEPPPAEDLPVAGASRRIRWLRIAAPAAVAIALLGLAAQRLNVGGVPPSPAVMRLTVDLGSNATAGLNTTVAISPDGTRIVFPARGEEGRQQLATRRLDQLQASLLPGTENASDPFFSPDGQWIGFFAASQLKKIPAQGGIPVTLCAAPTGIGASWGADGTIVAALSLLGGLSRVPSGGGVPQPLTKPADGEVTHRWPQILPGGRDVLFTAAPGASGLEAASIEVVKLNTGEKKTLQRGGYFGRYLPSGHLVYMHEGVLFGVAFDVERLELLGTPVPLVDDVASNAIRGGGQFTFSETGMLVYLAGRGAGQRWSVVWLESSGAIHPLLTTPGVYDMPRFSPDGRRLALISSGDLAIYDLQRETMTRLTFTGQALAPIWGPDGKHLIFQSVSSDGTSLSWIRADGAGGPEPLLESRTNPIPYSFSPDGGRVAYLDMGRETGYDLWTLPLDSSGDPDHPRPGRPELFLGTPFNETVPAFSPDGRWIAYRSNASGANEIYVRPFGRSSSQWQISTGGGIYGIWSNNGRELFYETPDNRIMVTDYKTSGPTFVAGKPRLWSDRHIYYTGLTNLALAPDGGRFAVFPMPDAMGGDKSPLHVTFLLNFFDELGRRLPRPR